MKNLKKYKNSIWRVPLVAVIAGFLYTPIYVRIVIQFGVIEPGVIAFASKTVEKGNIYFRRCCFCLWFDTASYPSPHRSNNGTDCGCIYVLGTAVGMDRLFLGTFFLLKGTF